MAVSVIDPEACISCGTCVSECPNGAISDSGMFCVIDPLLCDNCNGDPACQKVCPTECIKTVE